MAIRGQAVNAPQHLLAPPLLRGILRSRELGELWGCGPGVGDALERVTIVGGKVTLAAGDGGGFFGRAPLPAVIADGQIAETGHNPSAIGIADGAAIFVPVPVAAPMQSVFDGPVAARQAVQIPLIGLVGPEAGDQEDAFLVEGTPASVGPAIQAGDLSGEGKIDLRSLHGSGDQSAPFNPAMLFSDLGALRGKRPTAAAGVGGVGARWADCL
jgi:hypothetical protein